MSPAPSALAEIFSNMRNKKTCQTLLKRLTGSRSEEKICLCTNIAVAGANTALTDFSRRSGKRKPPSSPARRVKELR